MKSQEQDGKHCNENRILSSRNNNHRCKYVHVLTAARSSCAQPMQLTHCPLHKIDMKHLLLLQTCFLWNNSSALDQSISGISALNPVFLTVLNFFFFAGYSDFWLMLLFFYSSKRLLRSSKLVVVSLFSRERVLIYKLKALAPYNCYYCSNQHTCCCIDFFFNKKMSILVS